MAYYDTDQMLNTLSRAYEGDGQARAAIRGITLPYAVTDDYSVLILVQEKYTSRNTQGLVKTLNMPPEEDGSRKQVAGIFLCL